MAIRPCLLNILSPSFIETLSENSKYLFLQKPLTIALFRLRQMWTVHEITIAPSLRPPGTLLKILRNVNRNVDTQFKHVSRHPRVSTPNIK